jgi:hypothetical protein
MIIPALGSILLLVAIVIAVISPDNYWLYMLIGGIGVGILLGSLLAQRSGKKLS